MNACEKVSEAAIKWLFSSRKTEQDVNNLLNLAGFLDREIGMALEVETLPALAFEIPETPDLALAHLNNSSECLSEHSNNASEHSFREVGDNDDARPREGDSQQGEIRPVKPFPPDLPIFEVAEFAEFELTDEERALLKLAVPNLIRRWTLSRNPGQLSAEFTVYAPALISEVFLYRILGAEIYTGNIKTLLAKGMDLNGRLYRGHGDYSTASTASAPIKVSRISIDHSLDTFHGSPPREGGSNWVRKMQRSNSFASYPKPPDIQALHLNSADSFVATVGSTVDPHEELLDFAKKALLRVWQDNTPTTWDTRSDPLERDDASVIIERDGTVTVLTAKGLLCQAFGIHSLRDD